MKNNFVVYQNSAGNRVFARDDSSNPYDEISWKISLERSINWVEKFEKREDVPSRLLNIVDIFYRNCF